jgi:hypothetical protein
MGDQSFSYHRDDVGIAREGALDGFYVVRTSLAREALSREDTVRGRRTSA